MSNPKVTLSECIAKLDAHPTSPDYELAIVEFLDKSDAEQKRILFKALVQHGEYLAYLLKAVQR